MYMITYTGITFLDSGPNKEGKRSYILDWYNPNSAKGKHSQAFCTMYWKADMALVQDHGGTISGNP